MSLDLERAYEVMTTARHMDDLMWRLARQGRAHFAVPCAGHEAIGTAYGLALRPGHDFVAAHYRDLAGMLAIGLTARELFLHFFARADDPCAHGRQPYAHWGSKRLGIISQQGPQPNHVTPGVGVAWGSRMLGTDQVVWIGFGDGGAQKGEVHEAMNIAAIHRLPCVFCCENNGYTQSVPSRLESARPNIAARAAGYGIPGVEVDGMDVVAMHDAAAEAIARARRGEGPTYIDARCYRFRANTSNDDDSRYRSAEEVEEARKRDPWLLLRAQIDPARADALDEEAMTAAGEAAEWAEAQPEGGAETALEHTYATPPHEI